MRLAILRATFFRATWCVSIFIASTLGTDRLDAAITYINGVGAPTLFDSIVIGNFNDQSSQGWIASEDFSSSEEFGFGVEDFFFRLESEFGDPDEDYSLANDFPTAINEAGTSSDPYIQLKLTDSPLAGVPDSFTVGVLPGQFDIISFDLRFENFSLPFISGDAGSELVRGDQFFLGGTSPPDRVVFLDNNGGVTAASQGDIALAFGNGPGELGQSLVGGEFSNVIIHRLPGDEGFGDVFDSIRIDPIGDDPTSVGTLFSIDNVMLSRSSGEPTGAPNGDWDNDDDLDGADFLLWQRLDGTPATLAAWEANYGGAPLGTVRAVPEPGSIVLFGLAVALIATRRCFFSGRKAEDLSA